MKREDLEKLGLTTEALQKAEIPADVIDKIMALHGKDIEGHKTKLEAANGEVTTLKSQLSDANKQIEGFKGMKSPEEVEKSINDWKVKVDEAEKSYKEQVSRLKFDHALDNALTSAKVKNAKALKALLDSEGLKLDEKDSSILGLDKQLEALKESDAYLFAEDEETPKIVTKTNNQTVLNSDPFTSGMERGSGLKLDGK